MEQENKQEIKQKRRSISLRENLLRRKKAVKSRTDNQTQESLPYDKIQKENDFISS